MPDLDYAFLCDYVRVESGVAHALAVGIDTVYTAEVRVRGYAVGGRVLKVCVRTDDRNYVITAVWPG